MIDLIVVWLISAGALMLTSQVVNGFHVQKFSSALLASVVLGLLNTVLRPLLLLLTLPLNILTLGLFTFVVNAMVLRATAGLLQNFRITGWTPAILGAIMMSLIHLLVYWIFNLS